VISWLASLLVLPQLISTTVFLESERAFAQGVFEEQHLISPVIIPSHKCYTLPAPEPPTYAIPLSPWMTATADDEFGTHILAISSTDPTPSGGNTNYQGHLVHYLVGNDGKRIDAYSARAPGGCATPPHTMISVVDEPDPLGQCYSTLKRPLFEISAVSLCVGTDDTHHQVLYAVYGISRNDFLYCSIRVKRSTDHGSTWELLLDDWNSSVGTAGEYISRISSAIDATNHLHVAWDETRQHNGIFDDFFRPDVHWGKVFYDNIDLTQPSASTQSFRTVASSALLPALAVNYAASYADVFAHIGYVKLESGGNYTVHAFSVRMGDGYSVDAELEANAGSSTFSTTIVSAPAIGVITTSQGPLAKCVFLEEHASGTPEMLSCNMAEFQEWNLSYGWVGAAVGGVTETPDVCQVPYGLVGTPPTPTGDLMSL
jgi:hypothetical protein